MPRKAVTNVINQETMTFMGLVNRIKQGEIDLAEQEAAALPEEYGEWQQLAQGIYDAYQKGYRRGGVMSAVEFAGHTIRAYAKSEPSFNTLLTQVILPTKSKEVDIDTVLKRMDAPPRLPDDVLHFDSWVLERVPEARAWLDEYMAWSRKWSPRGHDLFHMAIGLWILSAVAARRIRIPLDTGLFTNLYVMIAAETSKYAKTYTAMKAKALLEHIGLDWLLIPGKMTPEVFYRKNAGRVDDKWESMTPEQQEWFTKSASFAGKYPWIFDEFGGQLHNLTKSNSPMQRFHEIFLEWYDCPERDGNETIGRGNDVVEKVYLALMAILAIDNVSSLPHNINLWRNGTFARFLPVTPPTDEWSDEDPPDAMIDFPASLTEPILRFHKTLGVPERPEVVPLKNSKDKEIGYALYRSAPYPTQDCTFGEGVLRRYKSYGRALFIMVNTPGVVNADLHGNYTRLQLVALKIAALLSWMGNSGGRIELWHWAAAQDIAELLRGSLHEFHKQVNGTTTSYGRSIEENVLRHIKAAQDAGSPIRMYQLIQRIRNLTSDVAPRLLENMITAGRISAIQIPAGKNGSKLVEVYVLADSALSEAYAAEQEKAKKAEA